VALSGCLLLFILELGRELTVSHLQGKEGPVLTWLPFVHLNIPAFQYIIWMECRCSSNYFLLNVGGGGYQQGLLALGVYSGPVEGTELSIVLDE
jgi:hypothetical protein